MPTFTITPCGTASSRSSRSVRPTSRIASFQVPTSPTFGLWLVPVCGQDAEAMRVSNDVVLGLVVVTAPGFDNACSSEK